jgi:hypothetical protein
MASAFTRRVTQRLAALDTRAIADVLLVGVDRATEARWETALERAAALPGQIRPDKVKALTDAFAREVAVVGAAAGVAAAAPAVGTTATFLASAAEIAWFTGRAGDLILTIAALHGKQAPTVDERRAWVLAVLLFGGAAREGFARVAREAGVPIGISPATSAGNAPALRIPLATLRVINAGIERLVVQRYGARQGVIALGRALPLGLGAAVGGGANYAAIRALARNADSFFARLPYSAIDTTAH